MLLAFIIEKNTNFQLQVNENKDVFFFYPSRFYPKEVGRGVHGPQSHNFIFISLNRASAIISALGPIKLGSFFQIYSGNDHLSPSSQ